MNALLMLLLAAAPIEQFAIVIGENRPLDELSQPLSFADDDAVLTHRLLTDANVSSTLLVRLDDDSRRIFAGTASTARAPTLAALEGALAETYAAIRAARDKGRRTELFFVYSGHGDVAHGEGYVALAGDRLSRTFLYEEVLAKSPADENHVIIDACRSYFLVFGKGPGGQREQHDVVLQSAVDRFRNTGFVLSTSSDRDSHEWERFRGGVFSHEVRSALRGGADADLDAQVTYAELGAFIETANESIPNSRFRPDAVVIPPRRDSKSVLLTWASRENEIVVPPDASLGHMYLEDDVGIRLGDAHPAPGRTLILRAPSSRPLFLRDAAGSTEYAILDPGQRELSRDEARRATIKERGAAHLAFRKLFSAPFTTDAVTRFEDRGFMVTRIERDLTLDAPEPVLKQAAPWVAGGALLIGGAMTTAAFVDRRDVAQVDVDRVNGRLRAYNATAVTAYTLAIGAGLTWLIWELVE